MFKVCFVVRVTSFLFESPMTVKQEPKKESGMGCRRKFIPAIRCSLSTFFCP